MYLHRLNEADPNDTSCIVRHNSTFFAFGFHCLVFELMDNSLEAVISAHIQSRALAAGRVPPAPLHSHIGSSHPVAHIPAHSQVISPHTRFSVCPSSPFHPPLPSPYFLSLPTPSYL